MAGVAGDLRDWEGKAMVLCGIRVLLLLAGRMLTCSLVLAESRGCARRSGAAGGV